MNNQYILPVKIILNPPDVFYKAVYFKQFDYVKTTYKTYKHYSGISAVRFPGFYNEEDFNELRIKDTYLKWNRSNYESEIITFTNLEKLASQKVFYVERAIFLKIIKYFNSAFKVIDIKYRGKNILFFKSRPFTKIIEPKATDVFLEKKQCIGLDVNYIGIDFLNMIQINKYKNYRMFSINNNTKSKVSPSIVKEVKPFLFGINFKIKNIYDKIQEYRSSYFINLVYKGIDNINTKEIIFNRFIKIKTSIKIKKYMGPTHYLILN